jgi:hypothetical protein
MYLEWYWFVAADSAGPLYSPFIFDRIEVAGAN